MWSCFKSSVLPVHCLCFSRNSFCHFVFFLRMGLDGLCTLWFFVLFLIRAFEKNNFSLFLKTSSVPVQSFTNWARLRFGINPRWKCDVFSCILPHCNIFPGLVWDSPSPMFIAGFDCLYFPKSFVSAFLQSLGWVFCLPLPIISCPRHLLVCNTPASFMSNACCFSLSGIWVRYARDESFWLPPDRLEYCQKKKGFFLLFVLYGKAGCQLLWTKTVWHWEDSGLGQAKTPWNVLPFWVWLFVD